MKDVWYGTVVFENVAIVLSLSEIALFIVLILNESFFNSPNEQFSMEYGSFALATGFSIDPTPTQKQIVKLHISPMPAP